MKSSDRIGPVLPVTGKADAAPQLLRIRATPSRQGGLLLDLPIAGRLALGFLVAAIVAASVAGLLGLQRAQSLNRRSDFYQNLLQTNTSLTTGASFLQLMNIKVNEALDIAGGPTPSQETLRTAQDAAKNLATRYDAILNMYVNKNLLDKQPDTTEILPAEGLEARITQQRTLAASAVRTWRLYSSAQTQILRDLQAGNISVAQRLLRVQGEPTNADALSALRALIRFDQQLAGAVRQAALVEGQNQLILTITGILIACLVIAFVGWFISGTIVRRLGHLRQVTRAVEQGQLDARVAVIGRDEIADVSAAVNAMLETLLQLLNETRQQRDALTNAAEHLFSDMRIVSAGDLRINAPVSSDPIGMLANAFNFTVGRFRRFLLRMQGVTEQLDVIARLEMEKSEAFLQTLNGPLQFSPATPVRPLLESSPTSRGEITGPAEKSLQADQVQRVRNLLQKFSNEGMSQRMRVMEAVLEQTVQIVTLLGQGKVGGEQRIAELQALKAALQRLGTELYTVQTNMRKGVRDLDSELARLVVEPRPVTADVRLSTSTPAHPFKEQYNDAGRQGTLFAQEINKAARQLTALTQEMRSGIISFQLDANNGQVAVAEDAGMHAKTPWERSPSSLPLPGRGGTGM